MCIVPPGDNLNAGTDWCWIVLDSNGWKEGNFGNLINLLIMFLKLFKKKFEISNFFLYFLYFDKNLMR